MRFNLPLHSGRPDADESGSSGATRRRGPGKPHRAWAWILAAGVVALVSPVLLFGAGIAGTGCGPCHETDSESPHASVSCGRCHSVGIVGSISSGVHNVGAALATLPLVEPPSSYAPVGNSTCLDCHEDVEVRMVTARGLRMNHATCIDGRQSCSECHGAAVHEWIAGRARTVQMDACLSCHGDIASKEGCELCHQGKREKDLAATSWSVTHGPNWQATHGAGDLSTCSYCHRDDLCTDCHLRMPHPEKWAGSHGGVAKDDVGACLDCHQRGFCDSCHGMDMPHSASWLRDHPRLTEGYEDETCTRCHLTEDCTACHERHTHPGRIRGKVTSAEQGEG